MRLHATFISLLLLIAPLAASSATSRAMQTERLPGKPPAEAADVDAGDRPDAPAAPSVSYNYGFATTPAASLVDMSSGTTTLIADDQDDVASAVTPIGFDFYFQGLRQDRFSVNSNGSLRFGATGIASALYDPLAQAGQLLVVPYGADQRTHAGDGKVHYKVLGAAPSRTLVVEWRNMQSDAQSGGTADLTYQAQFRELDGQIKFVYGAMAMSAAGAAAPASRSPQMGFSSGDTAGNVGTITAPQGGAPSPSFDGNAAAGVDNLYVAGTITVLNSTADGSRRDFRLAPPPVTAPGALSFGAVGPTSMTLNWADSPDELGYAIYQSTDGVNFSFYAAAAQNATSFVATGLAPSTTYAWQVHAFNEGARAFTAGTQATPAPTPRASTASGLWSSAATWAGGVVPTADDAVTIAAGTTVTIDTAAAAYTLTVAGTANLQFQQTVPRTLTVSSDVTVQSGGAFRTPVDGTTVGNLLVVGGNLTNNGTLDFSANTDLSGATIRFTGAANATFGGAGPTTDVRAITIDKGASSASILTLAPSSFTVRGSSTDSAGFLTLTNGTFRLSGSFLGAHRIFTAAAYSIGPTAGFWLDNPNYTVAAQNGSATVGGFFRASRGTFNLGVGSGNALAFTAGSTVVVDGGAINVSGRFGVSAPGNVFSYTQSAGTITTCMVGSTSTTLACFDLGVSTGSAVSITGGTIVVQVASTAASGPRDYRNQAGAGIDGVTGGTLQLGNAASGAAKAFHIAGVMPNLVLTSSSASHTATFLAPAVYNNIARDVTIAAGATLDLGDQPFLFDGTTFTNDGTLVHNGASSVFTAFLTTAPQLYTGAGNVTAPMTAFAMQADNGFMFDGASPGVTVLTVQLFTGTLVNANRLTIGNGGATTAAIQIGNATTPSAAGDFDAAPTFNPGAGGVALSYLRTTAARSTGVEVPPSRTLAALTIDENDATHPLTLVGGDLTATASLDLENGRVITGANTLIVGAAGTTSRAAGRVEGHLRKTFAAAGAKTFEIGTANGYSPVTFDVTAGTFPADATVTAIATTAPGFVPTTKALTRYWRLNASGVTANLTFAYVDPADVPATLSESNLHVYESGGGTYNDLGGTLDTSANTGSVGAVATFADFTLAEPGGSGVPILSISSPAGIDFGDQLVGGVAGPSAVTLTNVGVGTLTISGLTAASGPFARAGGTCSAMLPITLAQDESCTLTYTFAPASRGMASQNLTVTDDGPSNGTIALAGNGVQGNLTIAPSTLTLPTTPIGSTSAFGAVTLGNDGTASLSVTALTLALPPFTRTADGSCGNSLPIAIAVGTSCTLTYTFSPVAQGLQSQPFTLTSNATGATSFTLEGTATQGDTIFADDFE